MNYYYITGVSKGIGKALCDLLLTHENNTVIGISRSQTIHHYRYTHIFADLSEMSVLENISLQNFTDAESITFINNAGDIGNIKQIGNNDAKSIAQNIFINLTVAAIFCNYFINKYADINVPRLIINISSGAGKSAIDGWATYCAAKAGIDILSNVIATEQALIKSGIKIFSISPGVVDTDMQKAIRNADLKEFSRLNDFIDYKENSILQTPETVAKKLEYLIKHAHQFNDVIFALKDINVDLE
jgi:benzil reductase ((S)-benzoin forming)